MRKFLIIFLLLLALPLQAKMHPYFTTSTNSSSTFWMNKTNFYSIYYGISERYCASQTPNYTYIPGGTTYPYAPTNHFWAYDYVYRNVGLGGSSVYYPEANEQLYELVTKYCAITNLTITDGLFSKAAYTNIHNWTYKEMYEYLQNNFTNNDGTVGVGIYTNYAGSTNWMWTLSWETNEWCIELGSLVYSVTNIYFTNGIQHITTGWKYQDGDRIVRKPLAGWDGPPEWSITDYRKITNNINSLWWSGAIKNKFNTWWQWHMFGRMFDYVDMAGISNSLTFKTGTTNWTTLDTNLTLNVLGHTNYSSAWNSGGWYRQVTSWSKLNYDVSQKTTNDLIYVTTPIFDAGGYSNEVNDSGGVPYYYHSYATNWYDGLGITNCSDWTNGLPVTNHIGDRITLKMYSKNRLYGWPTDPGKQNWRTMPNLNPFIDNREFNERYAVIQLLRVVKLMDSDYYYFDWGWNIYPTPIGEVAIGQSHPAQTNNWAGGKASAEADWPSASASLPMSHGSYGDYDGSVYTPEIWASKTIPVLVYDAGVVYTNISGRTDWYMIPTNDIYRLWHRGTYNITPPTETTWDDNGDKDKNGDVIECMKWAYLGFTNTPAGYNHDVTGPWIGGDASVKPVWCDTPILNLNKTKGWMMYRSVGVKYWNFQWCTNNFEGP